MIGLDWHESCLVSVDMSAQSDALKERAMVFSIEILWLIDKLPRTPGGEAVARQLARSATSVAANYRAACICRSRAEFIAKLGLVLEESDECVYWLELISRARFLPQIDLTSLSREAHELRAISGRSVATARANHSFSKSITR